MIFKYRKLNIPPPFSKQKHLLRPIIPVSLTNKQSSIRYEALIDSGADFSIFPIEIAERLNIKLDEKHCLYFSGLEKDPIKGYKSSIIIRIGEFNYKTKVIFANLTGKSGILGQDGFFSLFKVCFSYKQEEIEIVSYS